MTLTAEDKNQFHELLTQLPGAVSEAAQIAGELAKKLRNGESITDKGISFLDVKNHLMLSYVMNLTHIMSSKLSGKSICGSADIERLVEIRTVLEKMRPIDRKLKYQIDKLVRTAKTGVADQNDPLSLKPNPDNFIDNADEDDGDEEAGREADAAESTQVYKPTKLAPVYYDGDESIQQKKERRLEMAKKRLANSEVVRDLHREYTDGPDEIRETPDLHRLKEDRLGHERREYEEKYFIRMSTTKKEKVAARQLQTVSGLSSLTKFSSLGLLTGQKERTSKKRKKPLHGKHKGSSSKRRKFRK